jgi:hypothetical protein
LAERAREVDDLPCPSTKRRRKRERRLNEGYPLLIRLAERAREVGQAPLAPLPKGGENGKEGLSRKNKKPRESRLWVAAFSLKAYEVSCRVRVRRHPTHKRVIHP